MSDAQWFDGPELEKIRFPYTDFVAPANPPTSELTTGPFRKMCINAEWAKFVVGALSRMLKPDAWEGDPVAVETGILAIEAMIAQLAIDHEECDQSGDGDGCEEMETPPPELIYVGGGSVECEESMGQVVTEVFPDYETGELVIRYGHCCEERYKLADILAAGEENPSEDPPDSITPNPPPSDIACRKAYWMGRELVRFMNVMWSNYGLVGSWVWDWASEVRSEMSSYKITDWSILKLFELIQGIYVVGVVFEEVWTDVDTQRLTCLYKPHLNDTDYTLSRIEYDAIKSATQNVGNEVFEVLIRTAFDALNWSSFQKMANFSQGITLAGGECDCPDDTPPIEPSSIYFNGLYTDSGGGNNALSLYQTEYAGRRVRMKCDFGESNFQSLNITTCGLDGAQAGDWIKVWLYPAPGYDMPPAREWYPTGPQPPANWVNITFAGGPGMDERVNGENYAQFASEQGESLVLSGVHIQEARKCPQGLPRTMEWYLEIVEVNGVALTPIGP